jgi:hypothetical protein
VPIGRGTSRDDGRHQGDEQSDRIARHVAGVSEQRK